MATHEITTNEVSLKGSSYISPHNRTKVTLYPQNSDNLKTMTNAIQHTK